MIEERLLRIQDVCQQTGFCRSHIYNLIAQGIIPRPVALGRARRWKQSEIQTFIASLEKTDGREVQQ